MAVFQVVVSEFLALKFSPIVVSCASCNGSLVSIYGWSPLPTPPTFLEEFYFADGLIVRGNQHRSGRPASAPGCHVTAAHPAITAADGDGDHHHPLALQDRGHLFAHRSQDGMNSFGRLFAGWTLLH